MLPVRTGGGAAARHHRQSAGSVGPVVAGLNATLTAAGFGILPAGGYWQKSTSPGVWVNVNSAGHISGTNAALSGTVQQGTLVISNVTVADNASYQLIVSNSVGSVTSSVVSLSVITVGGEHFRRRRHLHQPCGGVLAPERDRRSFHGNAHCLGYCRAE